MLEFLLKLTHKKSCKKEQCSCIQKQESAPIENTIQIPEKIVAEIDYEKLKEVILETNKQIELNKAIAEEKTFNKQNINIYKTFHFCSKILLFLISFLSLLSGLSLISLFFGLSPSTFKYNLSVLFFSIIFFVITFVADRVNIQISDIKSKTEIKDIFNSLVAFVGIGFAVIGTQIKEMITVCLNELLKNPTYLIGILVYIAIVIAEYIYKNKKQR